MAIPLTDQEIKEKVRDIGRKILDGGDDLIGLYRKTFELERKIQMLEGKIENDPTVAGII